MHIIYTEQSIENAQNILTNLLIADTISLILLLRKGAGTKVLVNYSAFTMKKKVETNIENHITLNNANAVIDNLKSRGMDYEDSFITMRQGNSYGGVNISESNIHNNSNFIVGLWD